MFILDKRWPVCHASVYIDRQRSEMLKHRPVFLKPPKWIFALLISFKLVHSNQLWWSYIGLSYLLMLLKPTRFQGRLVHAPKLCCSETRLLSWCSKQSMQLWLILDINLGFQFDWILSRSFITIRLVGLQRKAWWGGQKVNDGQKLEVYAHHGFI